MSSPLTTNIVEVALLFIGAIILPIYIYVYQYNATVFNMLQSAHVILLSLFAILYMNYVRPNQCKQLYQSNQHDDDDARYQTAFNCIFIYTLVIFFLMFCMYMLQIYMHRKSA